MSKSKKWWKSKTIITGATVCGVNLGIAFLEMVESGDINYHAFGMVAATTLLVFFRKIATHLVE